MKDEIWMNISITYYGNGTIDCRYYECIGNAPVEMKKISLDDARRMMWELVLAGGKRSYRTNYLDRSIVSSEVYIFLPM